ncbi:hypothetical protein GNF10_11770 [Nostoc sp. UCD121]|uniref:hypothetical protein n=1 Tax=Nostoc sp. UCD121 TaxID=2681305 RepID=UPI00162352D5|nr:hypothetical protein [Nostoc sp. UCD121]MBC1221510.1 hypothetical protein [Nostoc sp. UCD120]MBC1276646.1 hypothetical protein [Nostoc sp. UCD121]MBC1294246.1 hypothetical protein [Nostoc sp. UCD122]
MNRNPTLPPNFMLGYANAAPNLQNYGSHLIHCRETKMGGFFKTAPYKLMTI